MIPAADALAHAFYTQQQMTTRVSVDQAQRLWRHRPARKGDLERWHRETLPQLLDVVTLGQITNASRTTPYVEQMGQMQGYDVPDGIDPAAFVSSNDQTAEMLNTAAARSFLLQDYGLAAVIAEAKALADIVRTVGDLCQDAGATAAGAQISLAPRVSGFYRKLTAPSCSRCAVLAGAFYKWGADFKRHPGCDCTHIPAKDVGDDDFAPQFDAEEAIKRGEVTGISKADQSAIEDGADVNQVLNAKRGGMRSETVFGQKVQTTREGVTRRGNYGRSLKDTGLHKVPGARYRVAKVPRLTPGEIYRQAGSDRDMARRLLAKYGYTL